MLKALKMQLAQEEEAFVLIRKKYPPLASMNEYEILAYCDCRSRSELVQYVKELKIENIHTECADGNICLCTDGNGEMKYLYMSKKEAEVAKELRQREEHISFNIYACPTSRGWHLTKEG
jgi:hypothetical protein